MNAKLVHIMQNQKGNMPSLTGSTLVRRTQSVATWCSSSFAFSATRCVFRSVFVSLRFGVEILKLYLSFATLMSVRCSRRKHDRNLEKDIMSRDADSVLTWYSHWLMQIYNDLNTIYMEFYSHFTNWYQRHRLGGGVQYFTWMTLTLLLVLAV